MDDLAVVSALTKIKGIGPWTAKIYLLMAMRRPDVWPPGDIALMNTIKKVKKLQSHPSPAALSAITKAWRPFRSVAARMLWHHYLSAKTQTGFTKKQMTFSTKTYTHELTYKKT